MPLSEAVEGLETYMVAKKHQMKADRALGILVDDGGKIRALRYANDPYEPDADIDALVMAMHIIPPERMGRGIPPAAERQTKRPLKPKSKSKRSSTF